MHRDGAKEEETKSTTAKQEDQGARAIPAKRRSEACLLFVNWVAGLHFGNCFDNQSSLDQEPNRNEV